jgi:hypothetical protein
MSRHDRLSGPVKALSQWFPYAILKLSTPLTPNQKQDTPDRYPAAPTPSPGDILFSFGKTIGSLEPST